MTEKTAMARADRKRCNTCGQIKLLIEFRVKNSCSDGRTARCSPCMQLYNSEHIKKDHVRISERENQRQLRDRPHTRQKVLLRDKRNAAKARARFPDRAKARMILNRALKLGKATLPKSCHVCGISPEPMRDGRRGLQAHHHNGYSNPMDVIWICVLCHAQEHARARSEKP